MRAVGAVACFGIDAPTFDALVATCNARLVAPLKKLSGITLAPPDAHYALGAFLGRKYGAVLGLAPVEWESSPAERCVESGSELLRGLCGASRCGAPEAPLEDGLRSETFKEQAFKAAAQEVQRAFATLSICLQRIEGGRKGAFTEE